PLQSRGDLQGARPRPVGLPPRRPRAHPLPSQSPPRRVTPASLEDRPAHSLGVTSPHRPASLRLIPVAPLGCALMTPSGVHRTHTPSGALADRSTSRNTIDRAPLI